MTANFPQSASHPRSARDQWIRRLPSLAYLLPLTAALSFAQSSPTSEEQLRQQLNSVETSLQTAQRQIDSYHSELLELQQQVQSLQRQIATGSLADPSSHSNQFNPSGQSAADLQQAVADLQEQQGVQQAEIAVHEQSKLETISKYNLKLHGLVIFNALANDGAVDQPKLPTLSLPRTAGVDHGTLTATASQTLLGLAVTGPALWGAHTYADVSMDFSGGIAYSPYINPGIFRLRTADLQVVWRHTTVAAGVNDLILTPYYATSYFNLAQPALSWSGALWNWLPQLSVEHRFELPRSQGFSLQAALADVPDAGTRSSSPMGVVSAAERSRYPASEARTAYHWGSERPGSIGAGGYWSPHSYGSYGSFDAWAGTLDWRVPLPAALQFSGEIYRGSGLGGLSAGAYKDYTAQNRALGTDGSGTYFAGLKDAGGWAQLKFRPANRFELNAAFGEDNVDAAQLRNADLDPTSSYSGLARNQTAFGNIIFRPYSTFLVSAEYRRLRTWRIVGPVSAAQFFGLAAGFEF